MTSAYPTQGKGAGVPPPATGQQQQPPPPPGYYQTQPGMQPPPVGMQPSPMGMQQPPMGMQQAPIAQQPGGVPYVMNNRAMIAMLPMKLGRQPVQLKCVTCMQYITTDVRETIGTCQWLIAILLCSFLLFIFAWIPFVIDDLKDAVHSCPNCKSYCGFHRTYAPGY
ncbi:cell death-inducing p53-target protein 1-like [Clytia hemisphaerica]|eukprot:TCONS_00008310-protein